MKKIGILLFGLSLLTFAGTMVLSTIADPLFSIARNPTFTPPYLAYSLIGVVTLVGLYLIYTSDKNEGNK